MVHAYNSRKFTYAEDSLNAITSLLSVMSFSFSGGFISGLPEMFFDEALLWQPAEPMQRRQASATANNLPSWSWAGWEGEIMTDQWLEHWRHLRPSETKRSTPLVVPAVTWFFGNSLQERIPTNISGHIYFDHFGEQRLPLPSNWTYNGWEQYCSSGGGRTRRAGPVASTQPPYVITARYLFFRTERGVFKFEDYGAIGSGSLENYTGFDSATTIKVGSEACTLIPAQQMKTSLRLGVSMNW